MRTPWSLLLQTKETQPFFMEEVLHLFDHLHGPPLDLLQKLQHRWMWIHLSVLGFPGLNTVVQMGPNKVRAETDSHLPVPAGCPSWCSAGYCWPSVLQEHTAGSCSSFLSIKASQVLLCRCPWALGKKNTKQPNINLNPTAELIKKGIRKEERCWIKQLNFKFSSVDAISFWIISGWLKHIYNSTSEKSHITDKYKFKFCSRCCIGTNNTHISPS